MSTQRKCHRSCEMSGWLFFLVVFFEVDGINKVAFTAFNLFPLPSRLQAGGLGLPSHQDNKAVWLGQKSKSLLFLSVDKNFDC